MRRAPQSESPRRSVGRGYLDLSHGAAGTESPWSPGQYDRFKAERSRPFFDLLDLVHPEPDMRIADLGCGTGDLTAALHERLAAASTLGIDTSETMLAEAATHAGEGLSFEERAIEGFIGAGESFDLIFSNAALHWVDDHSALFWHLAAGLEPHGQLAVQMPANHDHPSHTIAHALAAEDPYCEALGGYARRVPVLAPDAYAVLLDNIGFVEQAVRLEVYAHHLESRDEVVEWVKGTLLTDYQRRMPADLFAQFVADYQARLIPVLDDARPYLYTFKRVFIWGRLA